MPEVDGQYEAAAERDRERQEEAARANSLRLEQATARDRERQEEAATRNDPVMKLKQDVRQKQIAEAKNELKSMLSQKANVVGKGTGKIYIMLWEYLLPSFGLTLIGIDIYVFMRGVLGKTLFPRPGDIIANQMSGIGGSGNEGMKAGANMVESIGLPILNLIAALVLLFVVTLLSMVSDMVINPVTFWWNLLAK